MKWLCWVFSTCLIRSSLFHLLVFVVLLLTVGAFLFVCWEFFTEKAKSRETEKESRKRAGVKNKTIKTSKDDRRLNRFETQCCRE